ncbi:hypothetical protein C8A05DRAFT_18726 [Staphylotrichum tortipilum]|uniref:Mmc1 C-terminal domain-containing protein n=1 Tax=Staphylotrichum tortipilum TaxID=2831512 RepID=A0AAN6MEF6_9PEZI|nr:hypothetical protein C8A05DRAFT_18726 [Staphylotrichum longicolle]
MPPALGLQRALGRARSRLQHKTPTITSTIPQPTHPTRSICLLCSLSRPQPAPQRLQPTSHRHHSTTTTSKPPTSKTARQDLHTSLLALHAHPSSRSLNTNPSRLQLALRNLSEPPGHESVRVAVLSVSPRSDATARRLLRLVLADPLRQDADAWEGVLLNGPGEGQEGVGEMVVKVAGRGDKGPSGEDGGMRPREGVVPEVWVTAPGLEGAGLEMLVARVGKGAADEAVLVPTVGAAAAAGTPVHMALLVGDGVRGAAEVLALPRGEGRDVIAAAVNFEEAAGADLAECELVPVNVDTAGEGLELFRADVKNAIKYETLWSEAGVGRITEWLRKGVLPNDEGVTKPPVRNLIGSVLRQARTAIQEEEARDLAAERRTKVSPGAVAALDQALADWSQVAHQELQWQLDYAFTNGPWRKLSWWKLFWRADDVSMVTSEVVSLRFLPRSEMHLVYLAGRIEEVGAVQGQHGQPLYAGPALPPPSSGPHRHDTAPLPNSISNWPTHIPFTRAYLQDKTVPALQALAQKLVVQSAGLAGLSTALAGLSYLSALGAYECGAIAALGIALSFRRLQRGWDAAREYWEGEVREEGRKAIRATEASVAEVLDKAGRRPSPQADRSVELGGLRELEELVRRAEEAHAKMK